jgi:nucleotide-binding universal stress UspA family protein
MPLVTYPDSAPDEAVSAAVALAGVLRFDLQATSFAADIPRVPTPLAGYLLNVPELIRTTEEKSLGRCQHLQALVQAQATPGGRARCSIRKMGYGATADTAAAEARYFDLALLPWAKDSVVCQEMAQTVVFGAGRPTILVPATASAEPVGHVAIAWDGSRVAARALADALPLLADDARITIISVSDEKPLDSGDVSESLASVLRERGRDARSRVVPLEGRAIGVALQDAALDARAQLLAMGGFGHSRLRDFILGGATQGVLGDLRLPVLMSH